MQQDICAAKVEGKKKGGCFRNIAVLGVMACTVFLFLALVGFGLNLMGYGEDADGDSVVVIPSRTVAIAASDTPIPLPTNTPQATNTPSPSSTPDLLTVLQSVEPRREIVQADAFEVSQTVQIAFVMGQDLTGAEVFMLNTLCAIKSYIPTGYRVRFAGDRGDTIEIMTAIVDNPAIVALDCPAAVDVASIASEYSHSEGLR